MLKEKWKRAWAWIGQIEDYTPEVFVKSQWQSGETSTLYLLYRWLLAGVFICGLIASMLDLGRDTGGVINFLKWPIYLTNWGFTLCTVQAIMSTIHVTIHYATMRQTPDMTTMMMKMKVSYKIYWVMHSVAAISAIGITSIYWFAVYDPKINRMDAVNLTVHLFNSVLMIVDLWVVAHPVKLLHGYWALGFAILYLNFNAIYYLAGGTDRLGRVYIYGILDWRQPLNAVLASAGGFVFLLLVTAIIWMMSIVRRRLGNYIQRKRASRRNNADNTAGPRIV